MIDIDKQLDSYALMIEQRWRALSDGERLRLMGMACSRCGALTGRPGKAPCEHYVTEDAGGGR